MKAVGAIVVAALMLSVVPALGAGTPTSAPRVGPTGTSTPALASSAPAPSSLASVVPAPSGAFAAHVLETARSLGAAGVPADRYGLPYVGTPARVENGVVESGYAIEQAESDSGVPVPQGVAYNGESDTSGAVQATTLDASSVVGQVSVVRWETLYFDTNTPRVSGIQLNAILTGVTIQGKSGYDFWTQNAVDYNAGNGTLSLGEDTWNFSSYTAIVPLGTSTVAEHSPNGSVVGGVYVGTGPALYAPRPFNLTLFLNSSVTPHGDQELWYNYSLSAAGQPFVRGNYDWLVFNSSNAAHPAPASLAPFQASGSTISPVGIPEDFEMDVGIGGFNAANMVVLAANLTETLAYCPATDAPCTAGGLRSVPAAEDYGSETGETGVGLSFAFHGTVAYGSAGPSIRRGLWGWGGLAGTTAGGTTVVNGIAVTGEPVAASTTPYVFVFFQETSLAGDSTTAWAPDVPVWHLPPGTYTYTVLLADYAEATGSLTVTAAPTSLAVTLDYDRAAGVYSPLWALNDSALAGISQQGTGSVSDQYLLFNNPTWSCADCGGASDGNLSQTFFFSYNDYLYPTFPGLLIANSSAYVDVYDPVSFAVFEESGGSGAARRSYTFDLPIDLYRTEHVTLRDATIGGWPTMFAILMLHDVPPAQNPFPQADVEIWDSSSDLVMSDRFVGTAAANTTFPVGPNPPIVCTVCASEDALLLYGGSGNTVWGSVFSDPPGTGAPCGGACAVYAGVAEAESGDLLYNNNFSVDNPVMYMAYDILNDSCWAGYAGDCLPLTWPTYSDRWNVTNQSAAAVSETVNGFALSGSIVGPTYPYQGGNFWWNYGDPLNPRSSLPYVDTFDYTHYRTNLPSGSTADEASLRVGGDYVPMPRPVGSGGKRVVFDALGLPRGVRWSVSAGSVVPTVKTNETVGKHAAHGKGELVFLAAPGWLPFQVQAPDGYGLARVTGAGHPEFGSINVTGPTTVDLHFGLLENVTFVEKVVAPRWPGLPEGSSWTVELSSASPGEAPAPTPSTTNGTSIVFTLPKGSHERFVVEAPAGYRVSPGHGTFTQPARALARSVKFAPTSGDLPLAAPSPFADGERPFALEATTTLAPTDLALAALGAALVGAVVAPTADRLRGRGRR